MKISRFLRAHKFGWSGLTLALVCTPAMAKEAYKPVRTTPATFHGPPVALTTSPQGEIPVGYFGPHAPNHPRGGAAWLCAQQAVREINQARPTQKPPLKLWSVWSDNPWGAGIGQMARLAYTEKPWAWLGSIDGHATHLAEQVAAKARFPLLDPGSTDHTVNLADLPWALSLLPSDQAIAKALAEPFLTGPTPRPFILLSSSDHDARNLSQVFLKKLAAQGLSPALHLHLGPKADIPAILKTRTEKELVILVAPEAAIALTRELTPFLSTFRLTGGPGLTRQPFLAHSQTWPGRVRVPQLLEPSARQKNFVRAFQANHGTQPDAVALATYDAVQMLAKAIAQQPKTRNQLLEALRQLSPYPGITGTIRWNAVGRNERSVSMQTLQNGQFAPDLL